MPLTKGPAAGILARRVQAALDLNDDDWVYLVEDDFLHRPGAYEALADGLAMGAEYVTLYDHPDKYLPPTAGGNPKVKGGGEKTRLLHGQVCHWKLTNSTVMTFACRVGQLRKDQPIILRFCGGRYTDDYGMFKALTWRGQRLISAVPGYSTHCETAWLSPFYDWASLADPGDAQKAGARCGCAPRRRNESPRCRYSRELEWCTGHTRVPAVASRRHLSGQNCSGGG